MLKLKISGPLCRAGSSPAARTTFDLTARGASDGEPDRPTSSRSFWCLGLGCWAISCLSPHGLPSI